jgi:hypothetical protein
MLLIRLRQFLIIALLCSNMVLGLMSYSLLRQASSGYAELVGQSVPILTDLHSVTLSAMRAYRATGLAILADTEVLRLDSLTRAARYEQDSAAQRLRYQKSPDLINGLSIDLPIESAAKDYHEKLAQFTSLIQAGRIPEAIAFRSGPLRVSVDAYCDLLDLRILSLEQRARQLTQDYSQNHQNWRNVLLALGSWPLLAAIVSLVLALGMLVALLVSVFTPTFRGRQA